MPHALLLSPDDQAVSAITGVLEEMSVTCERPLDGGSAAQKLNSHSFDLVLVDCENLPAAKLIFDVCRRGKNTNNPVPIAIVDGRAGLPTAFRLGAELILTKPVAKDQARTTIRTAVGRLRKDVPANESVPALAATPAVPNAAVTKEHAQAAAASSQLTSFAAPVPAAVPPVAPTAALSAPPRTTTMQSAMADIAAPPAPPKSNPRPASVLPSSLPQSSPAPAVAEDSKPARLLSDDPVLAELEETEFKESERKESELKSLASGNAVPDQTPAETVAPVFSSYQQNQRKKRSPLVALLMLVLAGGGLYAAWTYQPGFREIAQPQIDRVLALAGIANSPKSQPPALDRAKPSTQPATQPPTTSSTPAPASPTDPNQKQSSVPDSTGTGSTATSDAATVQPAATPGTVVPTTPGAKTTTAPLVSKPEVSKPSESRKDTAATPLSGAQLPGEDSAIILSSKGAERRLAHSIQPKFPVEAHPGDAQGTIVLKEVVDENGKVEGVRLVEGDAILATAAIQAVKQWRYRPYVRNGKAQPFQTVVIIDFQRP
jgi:TonB family protein